MEDALAYSTIYLFWISVRAISCVEDGTHYRPNHHAGSAERMFGKIESIEGTDNMSTLAAIRHPRLPRLQQSSRNRTVREFEYPHGKGDNTGSAGSRKKLNTRFKTNCTDAPARRFSRFGKMLQKLTAPGTDYEAFVDEFEIFYRELKEFFSFCVLND